jgi:hypothetical protein
VGVSWRWRAGGALDMEASLITGGCSNVGITYTLLRGRIERFGCGRTVWPLRGRIVSIWKRLWGESLQCPKVRVGVSQCPTGGWHNRQGTQKAAFMSTLGPSWSLGDTSFLNVPHPLSFKTTIVHITNILAFLDLLVCIYIENSEL